MSSQWPLSSHRKRHPPKDGGCRGLSSRALYLLISVHGGFLASHGRYHLPFIRERAIQRSRQHHLDLQRRGFVTNGSPAFSSRSLSLSLSFSLIHKSNDNRCRQSLVLGAEYHLTHQPISHHQDPRSRSQKRESVRPPSSYPVTHAVEQHTEQRGEGSHLLRYVCRHCPAVRLRAPRARSAIAATREDVPRRGDGRAVPAETERQGT